MKTISFKVLYFNTEKKIAYVVAEIVDPKSGFISNVGGLMSTTRECTVGEVIETGFTSVSTRETVNAEGTKFTWLVAQ